MKNKSGCIIHGAGVVIQEFQQPVLKIMIKWLLYKDHMGAARNDFQG